MRLHTHRTTVFRELRHFGMAHFKDGSICHMYCERPERANVQEEPNGVRPHVRRSFLPFPEPARRLDNRTSRTESNDAVSKVSCPLAHDNERRRSFQPT